MQTYTRDGTLSIATCAKRDRLVSPRERMTMMSSFKSAEELVGEWRYEGRQVFVFLDERGALQALFGETSVRVPALGVVWFGTKITNDVPGWVLAAWSSAKSLF